MMGLEKIKEENYKIFALLSNYLNHAPDYIDPEQINDITETGVSEEYAFSVILAAAFDLDIVEKAEDRKFFNHYFPKMIQQLDPETYSNNPYYKNITIPTVKIGNSELKYEKYKAYEGFVCNDIIQEKDGRLIPQIGFFNKVFPYPAVLEKDRIWMTITPNEIETMKDPIERASGNVLTYGLGLGYFAYMVSRKSNVKKVTVVDSNPDVIQLFQKYILPQFPDQEKIHVIQADAFQFAEQEMGKGAYDFVFTDLWHDVSDGLEMYLKMKEFEKESPDSEFMYWIEKSILCYL